MKTKKSNPRVFSIFIIVLFIGLICTPLHAGDFHDPPRDFLFGNHIDTHQETKLKTKGGVPVSLSGILYIIYTGATDSASGLPVARHPEGAPDEICGVNVDCIAGWLIDGVPADAKFLYHSGVNGNDHAVWMVNRVEMVQPGSFTHFHWITEFGEDPRSEGEDFPTECNANNAGGLIPDSDCPGWFLEIRAVKNFAFQHGGEIIPVRAGIDNSTHLNLVTNFPAGLGISPTR